MNDGSVLRVPTWGNAAPTPIALGQTGPRSLAVDATHVYRTNTRSGEILRVTK